MSGPYDAGHGLESQRGGAIVNINEHAAADADVCGDFRRGYCSRPTCKYLHNINMDGGASINSMNPMAQMGMAAMAQMAGMGGMGMPGMMAPPEAGRGKRRDETGFTYCGDFARGDCSRPTCSYVHNSNSNADRNSQICGDYKRGACERTECRFIHNDNPLADIQRKPPRQQQPQQPHFPPEMAMPFGIHPGMAAMARGLAPGFPSFPYPMTPEIAALGMGMQSMGITTPPAQQRAGARKAEECGDFKRGKCDRETCRFVHNINDNAVRGAAVCGDFKRGKCFREACKYLHQQE